MNSFRESDGIDRTIDRLCTTQRNKVQIAELMKKHEREQDKKKKERGVGQLEAPDDGKRTDAKEGETSAAVADGRAI